MLTAFVVAMFAVFLAEMGDKTQLMTMMLAAEQAAKAGGPGLMAKVQEILPVWSGGTVGMILADAVGILVGVVLHKQIPTRVVKWVAAAAFAFFGMIGMHQSLDVLLPKETTAHHFVLIALIPVMALLMVVIAGRSARRAGQ